MRIVPSRSRRRHRCCFGSSIPIAAILAVSVMVGDLSAANPQGAPAPQIRTIEIVRREVFEGASEGLSAPYRIANKVHIRTRERVVRRELLFATGEVFDRELFEQTERNLRALPFMRDARVEATPVDEDGDGRAEYVDVRVVTWDRWSLAPVLGLQKAGDHTLWHAGFSNKSLFGLGKELAVSRRQTLDRTLNRVSYYDPQLVGSRFGLAASLADLSDGADRYLVLRRPYYSLADTWSLSLRAGAFRRQDALFENGVEVGDLHHRGRWGHVEIGRAVRRRPTSALRLHVGYRSLTDEVGSERREFGIIEVGFRSLEHRFVEFTHVNRFEQTEDLNLGAQSHGTFGLSTPALGGAAGRVFFTAAGHSRGFAFKSNHFVVVGAAASARHQRGRWANALAEVRVRYLHKRSTHRALIGSIDFRRAHRPDAEVQLLLGAENGLRGYPVRQFGGTRALLVSAEQRWFVADDLLQLVSLGLAAFVDSGFAWRAEEVIDLSDLKTAVGGSLLVGANRLSSNGGARFDLGYALNPIADVGRWVFFAGSGISF